ncbi:MAG: dockerin type I domain-containing protein [Planctomycetaceae bacterium]
MESRNLFAFGDIDLSYGADGGIRLENEAIRESGDSLLAAAADASSGVWAIGSDKTDGLIARIEADGSLLESFGEQGTGRYSFEHASTTYFEGIQTQSDGTAVILGWLHSDTLREHFLTRILADGSVDTSFGSEGKLSFEGPLQIAESSDDEIYLLERKQTLSSGFFRIVKVAADGQLDAGFGQQGATDWVEIGQQVTQAFLYRQDGKLTVFVTTYGSDSHLKSWRYGLDGNADATFSGDGHADVVNPYPQHIHDWAPEGDTHVVFATADREGDTVSVLLRRYDLITGLDEAFGMQGTASLSYQGNPQYSHQLPSILLDELEDGFYDVRALVADGMDTTTARMAIADQLGLWQADEHGAVWTTAIYPEVSGPRFVQTPDRDWLFGHAGYPGDWRVVPLDKDGSLETEIGDGGTIEIDFDVLANAIYDFDIQQTGDSNLHLIAPGSVYSIYPGEFATYLEDGTLVNQSTLPIDNRVIHNPTLQTLSDTDILSAGLYRLSDGTYRIRVTKIDTRSSDAVQVAEFEAPYTVDALTFIEGTAGQWYLLADFYGAQAEALSTFGMAQLFRLHPDGTIDSAFADNGVLRFPWLEDRLAGVVADASGFTLVVANHHDDYGDISLVRVRPDGQFVEEYGQGGITTVAGDIGHKSILNYVADETGNVTILFRQQDDVVLARVLSDGRIDDSFGTGGYVKTPWLASEHTPRTSLAVDRGLLYTALTTKEFDSQVRLGAYDGLGQPAPDFGVDGWVGFDPTTFSDQVTRILPLADGDFLVGTLSGSPTGTYGLATRFQGPSNWHLRNHNFANPFNVSVNHGDVIVTPWDALIVINQLSRRHQQQTRDAWGEPAKADVNADGNVTPIDALLIINYLSRQQRQADLAATEIATSLLAKELSDAERLDHSRHLGLF